MNQQLQELTKTLGLINGLIPLGVHLGATIIGLIKGAIDKGGVDQKTKEQAQAAIAGWEAANADSREFIEDWKVLHPPTS